MVIPSQLGINNISKPERVERWQRLPVVGCWVTGINQQLLKWPKFIAEIPRTFRQVVFLASKPVAVFTRVLFLAPCNTFVLALFHLAYIDFSFLCFPGCSLEMMRVFCCCFFFRKNLISFPICGWWDPAGPRSARSEQLTPKITMLPLSSPLPDYWAHGMWFFYLQIKFWIFTHLRVVDKKDFLVYLTITVSCSVNSWLHPTTCGKLRDGDHPSWAAPLWCFPSFPT